MINIRKTKEIVRQIEENPVKVKFIINQETELGICITNKDGFFVAVNKRYTEIYGYSEHELIGNHFSMMLPDKTKEQLTKEHNKFIDQRREIMRHWTVKQKDGTLIKIQADAGYTEKIYNKKPHKITFVFKM